MLKIDRSEWTRYITGFKPCTWYQSHREMLEITSPKSYLTNQCVFGRKKGEVRVYICIHFPEYIFDNWRTLKSTPGNFSVGKSLQSTPQVLPLVQKEISLLKWIWMEVNGALVLWKKFTPPGLLLFIHNTLKYLFMFYSFV